jgi:hypothetical protein
MSFDDSNTGRRQYDDRDRGVLFKNDKKRGATDPDYTGSLNYNGADLSIAAWRKISRSGAEYLSISARPKPEAGKQHTQRPAATPAQRPVKYGDRSFNRDEAGF